MTKKIAKIEVIRPGSNPDVDTDFNTEVRNHVIDHTKELYGEANVASIGTFNTLAAKGSFKAMCTIYEVPFAQANKITELIPPPIEGVECKIEDIFDPSSSRYSEGVDFRNATSGDEWKKIVDGARAIAGRNKSTGVHPCGIVISAKPLIGTVPLQVRQNDGLVVSQWSYPELESLGLIKMDFLGLDTVDLIQSSVEYIIRSGKPVPNMVEIAHGTMDDKKTFEMLGRGESIGTFQLASPGVQDLLKKMKPTEINDIVATTALFRPGPMGMLSHVKYADRKNGREAYDYPVHPSFKDSPLEEILGKTYGLVVYQEQILQIANQIGGMTLQEGDDLRKAMGKKIIAKMVSMKPKFMEGGARFGYPEDAMQILWDTCAEFAKYGFNRAHSVGYGILAYQTAFLKANYPVEYISALIAQNVNNKDKILAFLQEARRMNLKVGSVDINVSEMRVAPDFSGLSEFDIVYGLSGVNAVSQDMAKIIIKEREANGLYSSVQDLINRNYPLGVTNRKIYENLAKAGAFDSFNVSRKGVVENLTSMLSEAKTKESKGASLFDMFSGTETSINSIDLSSLPEYGHVEKLKMEADVIGLYLTSHPLANVGPGLSKVMTTNIKTLLKTQSQSTVTIAGSLTEINKKILKRGGKSINITIDDGTGYISANLSREIVKGIDKKIAQDRIRKLYETGDNMVPQEMEDLAVDSTMTAIDELESNSVYVVTLTYRPGYGDSPPNARVNAITPLVLADDGSLPIRLRFIYNEKNETQMEKIEAALARSVAKRNPGPYPIHIATSRGEGQLLKENEAVFLDAIREMRNDSDNGIDLRNVETQESIDSKNSNVFGAKGSKTTKKKVKKDAVNARVWPPKKYHDPIDPPKKKIKKNPLADVIDNLKYVDSGYRADKSKRLELDIEKYLGAEGYDFGVFDAQILEDSI